MTSGTTEGPLMRPPERQNLGFSTHCPLQVPIGGTYIQDLASQGSNFQLSTHFTDGKTEALGTGVTCPRTHTYFMTMPGPKPRVP